ncbi:MAG: 1-acyl-sn-glycerol-3-phosphate acyltransferase [Malacoplasma sp.]|nr:1-acyl-sn-glycerol-3-phosphate acyltransferase [Malacoplasma sp.]
MRFKKYLFCLGHWLVLPFVAFLLWLGLKKSKREYFSFEKDPETASIQTRYTYIYGLVTKAVFCALTKVKIKGIKNLPNNKPALFIPNHKSNFDVLVLLKAFKKIRSDNNLILNPTFLAKKEILDSKKTKYVSQLINCVFLDRENLRDAIRASEEQKNLLQKNEQSLVVFIEGTRIKKDEFGEFKPAALSPAYSTFCPIIPVVIYGTLGVEKEHKKNIFKYKEVTVEFLEPFKYKDFVHLSKDVVASKIKNKMELAYSEIAKNPFWKESKNGDEE